LVDDVELTIKGGLQKKNKKYQIDTSLEKKKKHFKGEREREREK
jgi:hypothetical protein